MKEIITPHFSMDTIYRRKSMYVNWIYIINAIFVLALNIPFSESLLSLAVWEIEYWMPLVSSYVSVRDVLDFWHL